MTYDLTNLRAALSYVAFENGCLDCVYYGPRNIHGALSCRGPNRAEVHGVIRELALLGLDLAAVDEAVGTARNGRRTCFAGGHIGGCITPKQLYEVVEQLLQSKAGGG